MQIDEVPALIHQTEVSWDATLDPAAYFKVGQVSRYSKLSEIDNNLFNQIEQSFSLTATILRFSSALAMRYDSAQVLIYSIYAL